MWISLAPPPALTLRAEDKAQDTLRAYVRHKQGRLAYGIYFQNKKVGWLIEEIKLGKHADREVAVHTSEGYIAIGRGKEKSIHQITSLDYFELTGEGRLVFAEERNVEDKTETVMTGTRDKDQFVITTRAQTGKTERRVPLPRQSLARMRQLDHWLKGNPARGAKFEAFSTSLDRDDVNQKEVYTFREKKTILWGGIATPVYAVQVRMHGLAFETELRQDGSILK